VASLAEIRAKYPQYDDLSDQALADALHRKFYSDMPREEFDAKIGLSSDAVPPPGLVPGSPEYAKWAVEQVRAGKKLPQVSQHMDGPAPQQNNPNGPMDAAFAASGSFIEGVPVAGPTLLDWAKRARAGVHGMSMDDVNAEFSAATEANPIASGIGSVAGTIAPLAALGTLPVAGRLLGVTGGMPSQIGFGLGSGAALSGLDAKARGASNEEALIATGIGAGIGGAAPLVFKAGGNLLGHLTGRHVPREAKALARALGDDQIPAAEIPKRLNAMGDGAMVMDLGPNLQRQAGALASIPGPAQKTIRQAVADRTKNASTRVAGDVRATVGDAPDMDLLKQQIIDAQSAASKPLYDAVRDIPVPAHGGNYAFVFMTPLGKDALRAGIRMAANDGVRFNSTGLTVGMVDYAKRALDDIVAANTDSITGRMTNEGRQAADLARLLRRDTDALVPGYKAARDAYAGPAAVLKAIDEGASVFTKEITPEQLKRTLGTMTASERDAYLQGARASIAAQMGNAVNDVVSLRNLFRKGWNQQKLRVLLGSKVADDLFNRIDRELAFGNTANIVSGNSETAARQLAQQEVAPEMRSVRPEGVIGLLFRAFDAARASIRAKTQPKVNTRLADALKSGAGNFDPMLIEQAARAASMSKNGIISPAAPALLATPNNDRVQITVGRGY
jgi:hypothetical protein